MIRLEIVPEMDGLHINPCLPSAWTQAKMTRQYRGATYEITIKKPTGIQKGNVTVTLDGKQLPGNVIPPGRGWEEAQGCGDGGIGRETFGRVEVRGRRPTTTEQCRSARVSDRAVRVDPGQRTIPQM